MNTNYVTVEAMRSNPALMSEDTLAALWVNAEAAEKKLREACTAYQDDLRKRQAAIDQQQAELAKQIQTLTEKQQTAETEACNLVSRGDIAEAENFERSAEELGEQIAALERKRRILSRVNLEGNPNLYAAVSKARNARDAAWEAAQKEANRAYQLSIDLEDKFKALHRTARINSMREPGDCGCDAVFEHFNRKLLEQSRQEAAQKRREQEETESLKRRIVCIG